MEEIPRFHGDASLWGNRKIDHPGPCGNIMSCLTICMSSIVKEPHNITGSEETQGAVEIEDFVKQGKSMNPPQTRRTQ
jgi:hypothetical protein